MAFPQNFNKALFTLEELQSLKKVIKNGDLKYLVSVLPDGSITPQKEIELEKLKSSLEPVFVGYENKVKDSISKLGTKNIVIETPEQEIEIQRLIDSEQSIIREKNSLIQKKSELNIMLGDDKEEGKRIKDLIKGIDESVEELDKKYKKDFTLKKVENILRPEKEKVEKVEKKETKEEIEEPKKEVKEDEKGDDKEEKEMGDEDSKDEEKKEEKPKIKEKSKSEEKREVIQKEDKKVEDKTDKKHIIKK